MTIIKNIVKGIMTFFFLGLVIFKALEWSLYFFVAKPVAENIAYDVASYVEANDTFFTEDTLNQYLSHYRKKDMHIKVLYNQHPEDKRFVVKVDVTANWDSVYSPTAYFQTRSINFGETPARSVFARFDSQAATEQTVSTGVPAEPVSGQDDNKSVGPATSATVSEQADDPPINDEDIKELVENYVVLGMEAIREQDFSYIEPLLDPQGKMYKESQDSIRTINRKGLKEEVLTVQVQHITKNTRSDFTVDTYEEFKITYQDGTETIKGFNSSYRVRAIDNHLVMSETISVKEIYTDEVAVQSRRSPTDIMKSSCISCHGSDFEGGAGPGLIDVGKRMSKEEILSILENGKGIMPEGLVTPDEARLMTDFLMELHN